MPNLCHQQPSEVGRREAIRRELLIRLEAQRSILAYSNAITIPGRPVSEYPDRDFYKSIDAMAEHHKLILDVCQATSETPYGRAMMLMPPGSAKSSMASIAFASWFLGRQPESRLIGVSYAKDLALQISGGIRGICMSDRYRGIWGARLSPGNSAKEQWSITNGSRYKACGFMSGITGNRAHGVIIDDPVKNREQADSQGIRDKIWREYNGSLLTRLLPGGWIILIQTRWHEDDLAGRILPDGWKGESGLIKCRDGNEWNVLCIQAKATDGLNDPLGRKPGEYLWPEWFDAKHWAQFENSKDKRDWNSLFQQLPTLGEGEILKTEWWRPWPHGKALPDCSHIFASWDTAFEENEQADSSAMTLWGIWHDGKANMENCILLGAWDGKVEFPDLINKTSEVEIQHSPDRHLIEKKASGQSLIQMMRKSGIAIYPYEPGGKSKMARAYAVQEVLSRGQVWYPEGIDWARRVIDSVAKFPRGTAPSSDYADTCTQAWLYMSKGWWVNPNEKGVFDQPSDWRLA